MQNRINEDWHLDLPHSFGGKYRSYDYYKDVGKNKVDEEFKKNDIYTKFKQYKRAKHHNPVYVYRKREQFQADIVKFQDPLMLKASGVSNLLVIIDVFTKYVWLYPLKQIKGNIVADCLRNLFVANKPEKFITDAGTEFLNSNVSNVLNDFKIKRYVARGRTKASVVERFNRTIQRLIYQMCRYHNTNNWPQLLDKVKKIYHNRKHRTIKMTPSEAEKPVNQRKLRSIYSLKYSKSAKNKSKPKFNVGDTVRISVLRGAFDKGYHQHFTNEVWTISEVLDNLPIPRYIVKDSANEVLNNVLNENEVTAYAPSDKYAIDKILKRRKRNGKEEVFVSWLHYDKKFNCWIPATNLENI